VPVLEVEGEPQVDQQLPPVAVAVSVTKPAVA
jgi:hypothetical protein